MKFILLSVLMWAGASGANPTADDCNPKGKGSASCQFVRLDCPGKSMAHVPVTDEGDLGICQAHYTAEMVDAYRFSHMPPKGDTLYSVHTSAVEATLGSLDTPAGRELYRKDAKNSDFTMSSYLEGEVTDKDVLEYLKTHGVCRTFDVKSSPSRGSNGEYTYSNGDLINAIASMQNRCDNLTDKDCAMSPMGLLGALRRACLSADPIAFSHAIMAPQCMQDKNRVRINPDLKITVKQGMPANYGKIAERLLKPNAQPVEVGFCAGMLQDYGKTKAGFSGTYDADGTPNTDEDCSEHGAVIIGQREVNGVCQKLLRNSWGTSCEGYDDEIAKGCTHDGIWIDDKTMKNNTFDYGYLED